MHVMNHELYMAFSCFKNNLSPKCFKSSLDTRILYGRIEVMEELQPSHHIFLAAYKIV